MNVKTIFRLSETEANRLRQLTSQNKKKLGARRASIVAFAMMFGKDLLNYNTIRIGGVW